MAGSFLDVLFLLLAVIFSELREKPSFVGGGGWGGWRPPCPTSLYGPVEAYENMDHSYFLNREQYVKNKY